MAAVCEKLTKIRSILSSDGIVGGKDRWWVGNKAFDFVQSGLEDDVEAQETSRNICDRMERFIEELTSPDEYPEPASNDLERMQRGLDFILSLGLDDENFKEFGTDVFSCFYDVATTAEEPLRKFALLRTELASRMWVQKYSSLRADGGDAEEPSSDELLDFMMGIYALERVGVGHDSKEELRSAIAKSTFGDLFDLDIADFQKKPFPAKEAPLSYRDYTRVLTYSFYANKTGIDIHINFRIVLRLLPVFRPYENFTDLDTADDDDFDEYADQITLIFNVIHVLSSYGEVALSPALLPQEFEYICDPLHMQRAIKFKDVHLTGEICHCLRIFGIPETDVTLSQGLEYLRSCQKLDGSWPARGDTDVAYFRYHAAMCAVSCLNTKRYRGFGPSDPVLVDDLMEYRYATSEGINAGYVNIKSEVVKSTDSFLPTRLLPVETFIHLQNYYEAKVDSVRGELDIPPSIYGIHRLKFLMDEKELFTESRWRRSRSGGYKQTLEDRRKSLARRNKRIKRSRVEDDDDDE